jgi:putative ABC transport system permease protein
MIKNYLKLTFKVLARKKVFTLVTMAGIIIPVTLIVLISSLFMLFEWRNPPQSNFDNVVFLNYNHWQEIKPDGSENQNIYNPPSFKFIQQFVKTLKTPDKVGAISNSDHPEMVIMNNNAFDLNIKYTDDVFWQITNFEFIEGRAFNKKEFNEGARDIVIDKETSNAFFGTTKTIGKIIEIKSTNYKIIGVVQNVDITQYRVAANVYIPFTCSDEFNSHLIWSGGCNVFISMKNKNDLNKINNEFQQNLRQINFSDISPINRVEAKIEKDSYLERIMWFAGIDKNIFIVIVTLLIFFFIIFPAINLANININRIYERLSETGVRKTFGATIKTLIAQFLIENIIVVLIGSVFSVLFAWLIILLTNQFDLLTGIYLQMNFKVLASSLLAVLLIGILSGIIPSIRMAKSQITKSLNSVQ